MDYPSKVTVVDTLIPARFFTTMIHFLFTFIVFFNMDDNIRAALPLNYSTDSYQYLQTSLTLALALGWCCFGIEWLGFFTGMTMFNTQIAFTDSCLHLVAAITSAFYILNVWNGLWYWYIFGFCSAFPACLELLAMFKIMVLRKSTHYS